MSTITVDLGRRSYPVFVGASALSRFTRGLKKCAGSGRVFLFCDAQVMGLHARTVRRCIRGAGRPIIESVIPTGERAKSATVLRGIYDLLLSEQVDRSDFIVAVGGGVTGDLIGYAASTTLRGVRWGVLSTTLLGMVDASVGGKTGINHSLGKNLIGSIWQPSLVACDPYFLNTLAPRELVAGLGEVVKYAGLMGDEMFRPLQVYLEGGDLLHQRRLTRLIAQSVNSKAELVAEDEREEGRRMLLNLGHTFAHGIEHALGYSRLLHGEAVLLGLWAAVDLSCQQKPELERHLADYRGVVEFLMGFLPRRKLDVDQVYRAMGWDKKRRGMHQRFVLLERPGKPFITTSVDGKTVMKSLSNLKEIYKRKGGKYASNSGR